MTSFEYMQNRITPMRGDRKPREALFAFQIAAQRLAVETLGLKDYKQILVPANTISMPVYVTATDLKECIYIEKASYQSSTGSWKALTLYNQDQLENLYKDIYPTSGTMVAYTTDQGQFWPNRPPATDTQVQLVVAYKPVGDFDAVEFGPDFEDAIVYGALAHYLRLPGPDQDKKESAAYEAKFLSEASHLRGQVLVGDAGYARASTMPKKLHFGGTRRDSLRY